MPRTSRHCLFCSACPVPVSLSLPVILIPSSFLSSQKRKCSNQSLFIFFLSLSLSCLMSCLKQTNVRQWFEIIHKQVSQVEKGMSVVV